MFCGKTEELIRRLRHAKIARRGILVVKPALDIRYGEERVASHNNAEFPAIPIKTPEDILSLVTPHTDVVGIDEAQFFDDSLVEICRNLMRGETRVIVAGLDLDFRARPFGAMPQLLALADKVDKLTAICTVCGAPATRSQRLTTSPELVQLGAVNEYAARCHRHFEPPEEHQ